MLPSVLRPDATCRSSVGRQPMAFIDLHSHMWRHKGCFSDCSRREQKFTPPTKVEKSGSELLFMKEKLSSNIFKQFIIVFLYKKSKVKNNNNNKWKGGKKKNPL